MLLSNTIQENITEFLEWFQSLLSWMLLSNPSTNRSPPRRRGPVSILVILDVALKRFRGHLRTPRTMPSFNPCYPGCCSQTVEKFGVRVSISEFQSLLSWMLLSNPCSTTSHSCRCSVSILVILDVALKRALLDQIWQLIEFQSLLSWMLLSNKRYKPFFST